MCSSGVRVDVNADGPCSGPENCGGGADVQSDGTFAITTGLGNGPYRVQINVYGSDLSGQAAPDPIKITLSGTAPLILVQSNWSPEYFGNHERTPDGSAILVNPDAQQKL